MDPFHTAHVADPAALANGQGGGSHQHPPSTSSFPPQLHPQQLQQQRQPPQHQPSHLSSNGPSHPSQPPSQHPPAFAQQQQHQQLAPQQQQQQQQPPSVVSPFPVPYTDMPKQQIYQLLREREKVNAAMQVRSIGSRAPLSPSPPLSLSFVSHLSRRQASR